MASRSLGSLPNCTPALFVNSDVVAMVRPRGYSWKQTTRVIDRLRIRVLVADHDRWRRVSASDTLSEAGFAVEQASNGMAALRVAAADPPQIVLIGQDLPEVTPEEVVHTLRRDPRLRHTAVLQVRDFANRIELLATVLNALEARAEGRRHERPQTGTRQAISVRVSPQRSHKPTLQCAPFEALVFCPQLTINANRVPHASN
jgi:CheY-like chemotaxis protein